MKALDNYQIPGQISIFDWLNRDTPSMKMYPDVSAVTTERTLEPSLRKQSKWLTKTPMFLDLRKDKNGQAQGASWVTDIALLGDYMTHSSGVCHKEESAYVYSLTMGGQQHQRYYLNLSEKPMIPRPSRLSQILEKHPDPKYKLSAKACQGILNRAKKRGKELPELLRIALEKQSGGIKTYDVRISSEGTKNQRAHCYETDRSRALDTGGEKPDSNHGGVAIVGCDLYNQTTTGNVTMSITGAATDPHHVPCVIEGNGTRESHRGDGYKESDVMYTLNAVEQHAVAYGVVAKGNGDAFLSEEKHTSLSTGGGEPGQGYPCVCYGISSYDSNAMKSPNPHSGVYEADTSRTLDLNGGSPACNQGGVAVVQAFDGLNNATNEEVSPTLMCQRQDVKNIPSVAYGLDRASFNQGQNAKFGFSVDEELSPPLIAKGPGGGISETVGALCARDYKGVGNQYVDEGKCVIQYSG